MSNRYGDGAFSEALIKRIDALIETMNANGSPYARNSGMGKAISEILVEPSRHGLGSALAKELARRPWRAAALNQLLVTNPDIEVPTVVRDALFGARARLNQTIKLRDSIVRLSHGTSEILAAVPPALLREELQGGSQLLGQFTQEAIRRVLATNMIELSEVLSKASDPHSRALFADALRCSGVGDDLPQEQQFERLLEASNYREASKNTSGTALTLPLVPEPGRDSELAIRFCNLAHLDSADIAMPHQVLQQLTNAFAEAAYRRVLAPQNVPLPARVVEQSLVVPPGSASEQALVLFARRSPTACKNILGVDGLRGHHESITPPVMTALRYGACKFDIAVRLRDKITKLAWSLPTLRQIGDSRFDGAAIDILRQHAIAATVQLVRSESKALADVLAFDSPEASRLFRNSISDNELLRNLQGDPIATPVLSVLSLPTVPRLADSRQVAL